MPVPPSSSENKIGLWTSTSLVTGSMIASAIFVLPATLASYGSIGLLGWVFSAIGALFLANVFGNLSKLLPQSDGGPYAYTRGGFGDFAGFIVAWGYWISLWVGNAAVTIALVSALSAFFPVLAPSSNNLDIAHALPPILTALGAVWVLTWVNTRGIKASGKLQLVTTILKLAAMAFVGIGGLFFIHLDNLLPFNTSGHSNFYAITSAGTITLFAFLGVECATIPAGNVKDPEKTIPRATTLGTLITTVAYLLCTFTIMAMIPVSQLKNSHTPFGDAGFIIGGTWARYLVSVGAVISAFGALNGWILITGQIPYAVAKDKLFPPIFRKENKKGAPAIGIVIGSVLLSACMLMNYTKGLGEQFQFLLLLSTLTTLVPYLFCAAAYVIISAKNNTLTTKKWVQIIFIASISFAFSLWAIAGAGQDTVYWGFLLLMAGVPFYVWVKLKKDKADNL